MPILSILLGKFPKIVYKYIMKNSIVIIIVHIMCDFFFIFYTSFLQCIFSLKYHIGILPLIVIASGYSLSKIRLILPLIVNSFGFSYMSMSDTIWIFYIIVYYIRNSNQMFCSRHD